MSDLRAPFPYTGGKSSVSEIVWSRFGDVTNYVEPFAGSLAVLFGRPHYSRRLGHFTGRKPTRVETVNDIDPHLANVWRALQADPDAVAAAADWPVNEADLTARHRWLVGYTPPVSGEIPPQYAEDPALLEAYLAGWRASFRPNDPEAFKWRIMHDPDWYDPVIAAWWVWGKSAWIGSGWAEPRPVNGNGSGMGSKLQDLRGPGRGVNAERVQLYQAPAEQVPYLKSKSMGIHADQVQGYAAPPEQVPTLSGANRGVNSGTINGYAAPPEQRPTLRPHQGAEALARPGDDSGGIYAYFRDLAARLRHVRVTCGDWSRICGPSPTYHVGMTGVFLDPPYGEAADRKDGLYAHDDLEVAQEVVAWALEDVEDISGNYSGPRYLHPKMRICIAGYRAEHDRLIPEDWERVQWKAPGGYGNQAGHGKNKNRSRECLWFSPNCKKPAKQMKLF